MYFSDNWSFLLELAGDSPSASKGIIPVDLSYEEDWGDIEPYLDTDGRLGCTVGKDDADFGDPPGEHGQRREILRVWEYRENKPFNGKFSFFEPMTIPKFVGRLLDAGALHGHTEDEVVKLKRKYGL